MAMVSTGHEPEFTPPLVQLNGQPGQGIPLSMDSGVVAAELDGLVPRSLVFGFGETSQEGTNGEAMGPSESTGANLGVLGHSRVETVQRYTEAAVPCRDNAGEGDPVGPRLAKEDTYERLFAEGQKTYPPLEVRQVNWGQDRRNGDRCCDEASLADLALSFTARGQVNQEAIGESLDAMRPFNRGDAERETGFILALGVQDVRPSQVDVSTSATSPLVLNSHNWCPEGDLAELDTQDAVEPYDHSLMLGRNAEGQAVEDQEHAVSVTAFSRRLVQSMLSECSGQSRTSSYVEKSVQERKGSAELRIGVSSFPEISSDMLGTLDPPYPTYPGSAPEPISIGFSPRSLVVDPRPIKFRSNPKSLSRTRSRQADPGVYDDVEKSLHCRESNSCGAGWSGQPVSGGELASAEHGRTIPIPGPEQPVCLAAEDLGAQVMQHDGCKMAESRRVTMDPTFGTPTAGKPMRPPELCHPCCEVNVFEVKGDGITMDSSAWAQARLGAWSSTSQQLRPLLSDSLGCTDSNPARLQPSLPAQMSGLGFPISAGAQAQNSGVTQGRQSLWVTCHEPVATWFSREHVCGSQCFPPLDSKKVRSCAVCADCLSSSSEAWEADSDLQESSQVVSDLIPPAPEVSVYFQTPNLLRGPAQNPSHKPLGFSPDLPQVQGLLRRNATCDPNHKSLGFSPDLPQVQGSMRRSATCDPGHKPLGFSPDLPQVQGPIGGSINLGQNHEPIGFSPDLPQVQGSPCRAVNRDSSYTLLGLYQDAPMAQGSVNSDVNLGPEQYHIHSDDDDGSSASDVEAYLCWEQSWVDLHEPPQDWSSANAGPGILRMPVHEPGAQARRSDAAGVTWHVPIEMPSVSFPEYKTGKLELFPGPFFFGRLIASQVSGSNISFLPSLACTFMYRLLTLQVRQARGKARQIKQSTCNLVSSGANCWSPLPRLCMRRVLPAPSRPQSSLFLKDTLPGCTSVSGDDCGNALAQACICARWGETSSPEANFKVFLCTEPGQGQDVTPNPLRFSPFLSRALTTQGGRADQVKVPQDPEPLRFSPASSCATMVLKTAAGSGAQVSGVTIGKWEQVTKDQTGEAHLSQQGHSSQPKGQTGEVQSPDVDCVQIGDQVPGDRLQEPLTPRPIRYSPQRVPCEAVPDSVEFGSRGNVGENVANHLRSGKCYSKCDPDCQGRARYRSQGP